MAVPCGDMAESFDCLRVQKIPFWENVKKKKLTPPILIKIWWCILECTNNVAMQELEFLVSQFFRNHSNKLRQDFDGNSCGVQVKGLREASRHKVD